MTNFAPSSLKMVEGYFIELQSRICEALEVLDGGACFVSDPLSHPGGGRSSPRILEGGKLFEKAAVNVSASHGAALPAAATEKRPEFVGCGFEATAISLIVHPRSPLVPTTHANLRCFLALRDDEPVDWWFGGGFDLTPIYGFEEDAVHWHRVACEACAPFGHGVYEECKAWCDRYFFVAHRGEARGVGGLFFDDWKRDGFERSFAFVKSVGDHFLPAYLPIVNRRWQMPYGDRERAFQLYRRGRYAEFNLVYDRGTRYGLQSGKRTETVMASMPPSVNWPYRYTAEPGSPEERLVEDFLRPRDWLRLSTE